MYVRRAHSLSASCFFRSSCSFAATSFRRRALSLRQAKQRVGQITARHSTAAQSTAKRGRRKAGSTAGGQEGRTEGQEKKGTKGSPHESTHRRPRTDHHRTQPGAAASAARATPDTNTTQVLRRLVAVTWGYDSAARIDRRKPQTEELQATSERQAVQQQTTNNKHTNKCTHCEKKD